MKRELIYLIGGVVTGGAIGAITGYIFAKKKYEKVVNDELEKLKGSFKEKAIDDISSDHLIVKKPTEEELKDEEEALRSVFEHKNKTNYVSYFKQGMPNGDNTCDEDILDEEVLGSKLYPVEDEARIPYIIDEDAIEPEYDIVCLTYYEADGSLADDVSGDLVLPEDTVSNELLGQFLSSDEDQIYICKESHSTIYEITKYPGSYSQEVLGLPDEYGGREDGYSDESE